ncbi:MAG: glutamate ABC transporter substrate-binding protein [Pseudonocardia sp.]
MIGVNIRRPAFYLCVAGVLALASLLLTGPASPTEAGAVTAVPPVSAPPASAPPPCTEIKASLRPLGPLPPPGVMPPGSTMAAIAERGRLIVGIDQGKYLTGYRNPQTGVIEGSDIDLVRRITTAIFGDPNRVQLLVLNIADRAKAIEQKRVDLVVNTFTVTCERQKTVEFSTPYLATSQRLLVPVNSGVREIEDLAGQRVCTSRGSVTEAKLRELPIGLEVVTLQAIPDCMVDLQRGRVAGVSIDDVILAGLAAQDPQVQVVGRGLDPGLYAIGASPDAPDLVRFVNAVLERGRADGSLAAGNQRWLNVLNPVPQSPPATYRD